jgi:UPF0271 protein
MTRVDFNCDVGEGAGSDAELMPFITSANIACGAHAGDSETMRETFRLAEIHGVAVGAHPGFFDRENFGRVERPLVAAEMVELVEPQIAALHAIVGRKLRHVKLHGALYNRVSRDTRLSAALVELLGRSWPDLTLFVLANSELWNVARQRGLRVASEVFADRTYRRDGSLTPRSQADALIHNEDAATRQVLRMLRESVVRATDGTEIAIKADTVCLHGDGPNAVAFAQRLRRELAAAGVEVKAFDDR